MPVFALTFFHFLDLPFLIFFLTKPRRRRTTYTMPAARYTASPDEDPPHDSTFDAKASSQTEPEDTLGPISRVNHGADLPGQGFHSPC